MIADNICEYTPNLIPLKQIERTYQRQRSLIETIASDALHLVMDFLSPKEGIALSTRVCKSWDAKINPVDQRYWKVRYQRLGGIIQDAIRAYEVGLKSLAVERLNSNDQLSSLVSEYANPRVEYPLNLFKRLCCPPVMAIGKEKWMKLLRVDVGIEPPLPLDIHSILKSACPFWPGKTIEQTHTLVLVPEKVNGKPLTLKLFGELLQDLLPTSNAGYCQHAYFDKYANIPFGPSRWVLMTRDIIPGSKKLNYASQQKLVSSKANYEVPTLPNAAASIMMDYISNWKSQFKSANLGTYTRCQETSSAGYQMLVGALSLDGLDCRDSDDYIGLGIAPSLVLSSQ